MAADDRFSKPVIATLAKRAANRCSNPDCGAITSGPSDDPTDSVNVGEAAHIYGANPGSARHDPDMASADRSCITNAIWLCGNCHKLVDDDEARHPADLLIEWKRNHESHVASKIGKATAEPLIGKGGNAIAGRKGAQFEVSNEGRIEGGQGGSGGKGGDAIFAEGEIKVIIINGPTGVIKGGDAG